MYIIVLTVLVLQTVRLQEYLNTYNYLFSYIIFEKYSIIYIVREGSSENKFICQKATTIDRLFKYECVLMYVKTLEEILL